MDTRDNVGEYREVGVVRGEDGIAARITERFNDKGNRQLSFSLYREYPKGKERKETFWFSPRHLPAIQKLMPDIEETIQREIQK